MEQRRQDVCGMAKPGFPGHFPLKAAKDILV